MNDLDTDARDPELAARLGRLAERGPHRDPDGAIDHLLAEATGTPSTGRRLFAVAAGLAVLGGLGVAGWTAARPDDGAVIADVPSTMAATTTSLAATTTSSTSPTTSATETVVEEATEADASVADGATLGADLVPVAAETGLRLVVADAGRVGIASPVGAIEFADDAVAVVVDQHVVTGPRVYSLGADLVCETPDGLPGIHGDLRYPLIDAVGVDDGEYWVEYSTFDGASAEFPVGSQARYRHWCGTGKAEEVAPTRSHGSNGEGISQVAAGVRRFTVTYDAAGYVTIANDDGVSLTGDDLVGYQHTIDESLVAYTRVGTLDHAFAGNEVVIRDATTGNELLRRTFGEGEQLVSYLDVVDGSLWVGVSGAGWATTGDPTIEALHRIDPATGEETTFEVDAPVIWIG